MRFPQLIVGFGSLWICSGCLTHQSRQTQSLAPRAVANIEFVGATLTHVVSKPQLADWWTKKLNIGSASPDAYFFLTTTNGQEKRIHVETCQQYTNAINKGAYAFTTADMAMDSWFVRAVAVLRFIKTAQPSTHPLPDDFLNRLPVSLVGWNGSDEEAQLNRDTSKGLTLKDYALNGKVKKLKAQNHSINFRTKAKDFAVEELACGDVDGDGFEDALISVTWHYQEGSGFGYELYVVARASKTPSLHLNALSIK